MANEAVIVYKTQEAIPFTVSNTTGIEKGAILKMTDPMTASLSDGTDDTVAGIAASEKIASDGKTKLGVFRGGVFKVKASGAVTVGDPLGTIAGNYVASNKGTNGLSGSKIIGIALETAADTETFLMELRPTVQTENTT